MISSKVLVFREQRIRMTCALVLCVCTALRAEDPVTIAVMDFQGKNVSAADASTVADFLRTELVNTGAFIVVERGNMDKLLAEAGFQLSGCTEAGCAVEVGRILNVRRMVVGSLSRIETMYYINVSVVDVETGRILKAYREEAESARGLAPACERLARAMAGVPAVPSSSRAAQPVPSSREEAYQGERMRELHEGGSSPVVSPRFEESPGGPQMPSRSGSSAVPSLSEPPSPPRKQYETNGYLEVMAGGTISGFLNVQFQNQTYPIEEGELGLDLNGNGIIEGVGYNFVRFTELEAVGSTPVLGVRLFGFVSRVVGLELLASYWQVSTIAQTEYPNLNHSIIPGNRLALPDQYLTLSDFSVCFGLFLRPVAGPFQPYAGCNIGLSLFNVYSPHIAAFTADGVFTRPLDEVCLGLTVTPLIAGVRLLLGDVSFFAEYRLVVPMCFFDRLIKSEEDYAEGMVGQVTGGIGMRLFE